MQAHADEQLARKLQRQEQDMERLLAVADSSAARQPAGKADASKAGSSKGGGSKRGAAKTQGSHGRQGTLLECIKGKRPKQ